MAKVNCKASVGCIVKHGSKLVVVYEKQNDIGAWDIPAGGIEAGETPEEAVVRELQEEIGLNTSASELRLRKIFWASLDVPTVHFLYELTINDSDFQALRPNTSDIQKIAGFTQEEVQEIIDTKTYEHELAKSRLLLFLEEKDSDSQLVCIMG